MYSTDFNVPDGVSLPVPSGYRMLILMAKVEEKTSGGIFRPDLNKAREENASQYARVIAQGPDCYKDTVKFPTGPWCFENDIVTFRAYSGTGFVIGGREFRFINDDTVDGVVHDIDLITKVDRK